MLTRPRLIQLLLIFAVSLAAAACLEPDNSTRTASVNVDLQIPTEPAAATQELDDDGVRPVVITITPTSTATSDSSDGGAIPANNCQVREDWPEYVVQAGDTLARIANLTGSTVTELAGANCLPDANSIFAGQRLRVPRAPVTVTPVATSAPASWQRYYEPLLDVSFAYPGTWTRQDGWIAVFGGSDGHVRLAVHESPHDVYVVAQQMTEAPEQPYGSAPTLISFTLAGGYDGQLILPSADQAERFRNQAAFFTYLPQPVILNGASYNYLVLAGDADHLQQMVPTISMPAAPANVVIDTFTVDAQDVGPGRKLLTINWTSTGATRAMIVVGTARRFMPWWPVTADGELVVEVSGTNFPDPPVSLTVWNDVTGAQTQESITLIWPCAYEYFFAPPPEYCPRGPVLAATGAYQEFEHGRMIWVPREDGNFIYVIGDDGSVYAQRDEWTDALPDSDPDLEPPAGFYQPVRGFGLVWRDHEFIRERLGWATAPEFNYDLNYQSESRESIPSVTYLTLPDGTILQVRDTGWDIYIP